jgi:hypothetical protein
LEHGQTVEHGRVGEHAVGGVPADHAHAHRDLHDRRLPPQVGEDRVAVRLHLRIEQVHVRSVGYLLHGIPPKGLAIVYHRLLSHLGRSLGSVVEGALWIG